MTLPPKYMALAGRLRSPTACPNPDCRAGQVLSGSGEREVDCPTCEGTGRRCPECRESMPASAPKDARRCAGCTEAMAEDAARAKREERRLNHA